jgi:hypothetical protein
MAIAPHGTWPSGLERWPRRVMRPVSQPGLPLQIASGSLPTRPLRAGCGTRLARKLKVFRTPIGFHDAYVAAPSQKAALKAWGSDADLFGRGIAELVTDEELTREPLAHPGKVIKRLRASAAEQLAALPADDSKLKPSARKGKPTAKTKQVNKAEPASQPRPSRANIEEAERRLSELIDRQTAEEQELRAREKALDHERRDLDRTQGRNREAAERDVDQARRAHSDALAKWLKQQP